MIQDRERECQKLSAEFFGEVRRRTEAMSVKWSGQWSASSSRKWFFAAKRFSAADCEVKIRCALLMESRWPMHAGPSRRDTVASRRSEMLLVENGNPPGVLGVRLGAVQIAGSFDIDERSCSSFWRSVGLLMFSSNSVSRHLTGMRRSTPSARGSSFCSGFRGSEELTMLGDW